MEKSLASSERMDFGGGGRVGKIKYIFRYLILITSDSHQCYSITLRRLVSGAREMNWGGGGVRRKNTDTAQYLVCPPYAAKTARQRRIMLQISVLMTCNGILTHLACKARSRSRMLLTSWRSLT